MSEQAQIAALAAAQVANEAVAALLLYGREGGALDIVFEADALGKLAEALRIGLEAYPLAEQDGELLSALIRWIEWRPAA